MNSYYSKSLSLRMWVYLCVFMLCEHHFAFVLRAIFISINLYIYGQFEPFDTNLVINCNLSLKDNSYISET